jgi:hypothetical protein
MKAGCHMALSQLTIRGITIALFERSTVFSLLVVISEGNHL